MFGNVGINSPVLYVKLPGVYTCTVRWADEEITSGEMVVYESEIKPLIAYNYFPPNDCYSFQVVMKAIFSYLVMQYFVYRNNCFHLFIMYR